jgi:hypothetical protein
MAARPKARPHILGRRAHRASLRTKQWLRQGALPMKGLANVRAELSLAARI